MLSQSSHDDIIPNTAHLKPASCRTTVIYAARDTRPQVLSHSASRSHRRFLRGNGHIRRGRGQ